MPDQTPAEFLYIRLGHIEAKLDVGLQAIKEAVDKQDQRMLRWEESNVSLQKSVAVLQDRSNQVVQSSTEASSHARGSAIKWSLGVGSVLTAAIEAVKAWANQPQ